VRSAEFCCAKAPTSAGLRRGKPEDGRSGERKIRRSKSEAPQILDMRCGMRDAGWGARRVGDLPSPKSYGEASRRSGGPARQVGGAGAFLRNWTLSVHGFKLFFLVTRQF
jgi:hypothetical protein